MVEREQLIFNLDSQILNTMDQCAEKYRLEHIEHWRPMRKALALEKGSLMHTMLRVYRQGKKDGRVGLEEHGRLVDKAIMVSREASSSMSIESDELEEEIRTFQSYVLRWQYDGWEILDIEQPFSKILYEDEDQIDYNGKLYSGLTIIYEGVIDALVRDPKVGIVVVDTKTEGRKSYPYILSNQFQGYEWAFNCPVIVDKVGFQKTLADNERFTRLEHRSGQPAIDEWRADAIEKVREAIAWHRDLTSGRRDSLRKNRTSCDKYSGCIFQGVCKVPKESRTHKLQAFFFKDKQWDPYDRPDFDEIAG